VPTGIRDLQRAATEAALLEAAWQRYAGTGPDGSSLREVAEEAGCNHALVARYFRSKDGLSAAVLERLDRCIETAADAALTHADDPVVALLGSARRDRPCVQLTVRTALGDFGDRPCPAARHVLRVLAAATDGTPRRRSTLRSRLCAYGAASLVLGWLTYEDFVAAGTRLGPVGARRRDRAIAAAAGVVLRVADGTGPRLRGRLRLDPSRMRPEPPATRSSEQALIEAAVELFALRGPASVSVRDVGRRAGVNQGLIYRHFGSKQALVAAAFELGSSDLFPAALAPDGFDIDTVVHQVHHGARAPRLIARILADDVDITTVRKRFPILRRLLDAYPRVPTGAATAGPVDPRIAVAAVTCLAMGSAVYGRDLLTALDLPADGSVEFAVANLCRVLLAEPLRAGGSS
jgi:AcrR family transcriptional regulator